ncbi:MULTISPECIES: dynamin family protein [unclassified Acidovorax]|uniref:dynamin family protein n=1 Tax=unclassified Acidovorax TaxID=2684926 RepID=UPI002882E36F|nr:MULTISPECIES: dynamin family protein [unclassified Acidovorax]
MTEKSITREALLASFGALESQFTSSLKNAQALEQTFDASRAKLVHAISSHLQNAQKSLPLANPLQAPLNNFVATMTQTSREWDVKVAGRQKGVEFRQGFEDSLLVFVSGKVKSGKSSLGNYMAWGHTDPTDDAKRQTLPERYPKYKSHAKVDVEGGDSPKEAEKKREFRVGATEATSSIQSFSLPGLTWVDSPGLHSMKEENGKLAREYLDHADLILYTMKSDAPGRASDLAEIRDLIHKDKRTLLLLTGSDDIEEDVNDSGDLIQCIVMKDAARRAKQQDYVRGELKARPDSNKLEIVSISSRYAQEHANDEAAFLDSGIGPFCATLQDICQSEGVKIKQRVPMRNLHHFLVDCENDLEPYQKLIADFSPVMRKLDESLENQISQHSREGQHDLKRFIDTFFVGTENIRDDADLINSQLKNFNSKLGEKFHEIANDRLQAIADDLTKEFQASVKSTYQHSLLTRIPDFKLDTITEKVEVGTRSGTKKRNAGIGSLLGAGIGFLVAGPAGAAVGSMVGGGLGGVTGDSASIRYRDVQITVGDNLQGIRRTMLDTHREAFDIRLKKDAEDLWQQFDGSIKNLLKQLSAEMEQFDSELQQILNRTQIAL